jgi:two-component system phosphate regulon sensor histidine kinase PhoR
MTSRHSRSLRTLLWSVGSALIAAFAIGWWLHAIAACLLAVAAPCLAWGAYRLARFDRWLESGRRRPDASSGFWSDVEETVARRRRIAFAEKRQLVGLLRAFRDAAAALPDAVVALDGEHRIQWFNAAARALLGLAYPEDIGGPVTNLLRAPRTVCTSSSLPSGSRVWRRRRICTSTVRSST